MIAMDPETVEGDLVRLMVGPYAGKTGRLTRGVVDPKNPRCQVRFDDPAIGEREIDPRALLAIKTGKPACLSAKAETIARIYQDVEACMDPDRPRGLSRERELALRALVRRTIADALKGDLNGNELLMKEVWEECGSGAAPDVRHQTYRIEKTLVDTEMKDIIGWLQRVP